MLMSLSITPIEQSLENGVKISVTINTFLSKTFLRENQYLESLLPVYVDVVEKLVDKLKNILYTSEVNPEWKHYCGAEPRWLSIDVVLDKHGFIREVEVVGGEKWRMKIMNDGLAYTVVTDGCWSLPDIINMLNDFLQIAARMVIAK